MGILSSLLLQGIFILFLLLTIFLHTDEHTYGTVTVVVFINL